jgi:hypothetical protein
MQSQNISHTRSSNFLWSRQKSTIWDRREFDVHVYDIILYLFCPIWEHWNLSHLLCLTLAQLLHRNLCMNISSVMWCLKTSVNSEWVIIYLKHLHTKTGNNCEFSLKAKHILDKLVKVRVFFPNILKNT